MIDTLLGVFTMSDSIVPGSLGAFRQEYQCSAVKEEGLLGDLTIYLTRPYGGLSLSAKSFEFDTHRIPLEWKEGDNYEVIIRKLPKQ